MNEMKIFDYHGNTVRTVERDGEPCFVLKDVCAVLGIANHKMTAQRLDEDEVSWADLTDSLGRKQGATIINESGLYNVILRSDKPEAKPFRKWVTSEVLPAIRKTGGYGQRNNPRASTGRRGMVHYGFLRNHMEAIRARVRVGG